jgi:hypothetical protein
VHVRGSPAAAGAAVLHGRAGALGRGTENKKNVIVFFLGGVVVLLRPAALAGVCC